jgi:hypothetical protein
VIAAKRPGIFSMGWFRPAQVSRSIAVLDKSLRERIDDAFGDQNAAERSYADAYLERVLENLDAANAQLRRITLGIALLVAVFFLFAHSKSSEIDLGPFKLSDVKGVLTLVPAVVSYLAYELAAAINTGALYENLIRLIVAKLYPKLFENDLNVALPGVTQQIFGGTERQALLDEGSAQTVKWRLNLDLLNGLGATFGVPAFLVYAYVTLAGQAHTSLGVVIASAAFAGLNVARAGIELVLAPAPIAAPRDDA